MTETINRKIKEKIRNSEIDESVKSFLIEILQHEYEHSEEKNWKYKQEYERLIKKYSQRIEV